MKGWTMRLIRGALGLFALLALAQPLAWANDGDALQRKLDEKATQDPKDNLRGGQDRGLSLGAPQRASPKPGIASQIFAQRISVVGATALGVEELKLLTAPFLARPLGQADLDALAAAVTAQYQSQGLFLSFADIPKQALTDGVLTVIATEGFVDRVSIEGPYQEELLAYFADVLGERPLTLATLERALLILGDLEGLDTGKPKLAPSPDRPGAYHMTLKVQSKHAGGRLTLDNRGDDNGGPVSLTAQVWTGSLAVPGDQLSLSFATALDRPKEAAYAELSWAGPLDSLGTIAEVTVSAKKGEREALWSPDYNQSEGWRAEAGLSYPLLRTRRESLWFSMEAGISRERSGGHTEYESKDHLIYLSPALSFESNPSKERWLRGQLNAKTGMDTFDPNPPSAVSPSNGQAFAIYGANATWSETFGGKWSLLTRLKAQWTDGQVPDDLEFSIGGGRFGRAYDYGELDGPVGAAGAVELRYTETGVTQWMKTLRLYAFADAGAVWQPRGHGEAQDIASAGVGLKAWLLELGSAELTLAQPLNERPGATGDRSPRLFFEIGRDF